MFNAQEFLQDQMTGSTDTRYKLVPPGDYPALVDGIDAKQQPDKSDPTKVYTILDVTFSIESPQVKEAMGLSKVTARHSVFLELNDSGKVDFSQGKNVPLGRLREATGTNYSDRPFTFNDLVGKACIVTIINEPDKNDPRDVWTRVKKVGAIGGEEQKAA